MNRSSSWVLSVLVAVTSAWVVPWTVAFAQTPGMPDPRAMSGVPRPDSQVPVGQITVRVLLGGFSEPAVGVTVKLTARREGRTQSFREVTQDQGRATFAGLEEFVGGEAIAEVDLDGEVVRSQPIKLLPVSGSRVLLVQGASPSDAASLPGGPHTSGPAGAGPHDLPLPGEPFAVEGHPKGTLIVGTLDLRTSGGRAVDVEVKLTIHRPGMETPKVVSKRSGADGRAVFGGLLPPEVVEGTTFVVEASIDPAGEPQRSQPFSLVADATAIYLAEGLDREGGAGRGSASHRRAALPGPRELPELEGGAVRVRVVGPADEPVAEQKVEIWRKDITGDSRSWSGTTDSSGIAIVGSIDVGPDALYFVGIDHDGAPYQSSFFEMSEQAGVAIDMRVYPVTSDVSRVRSMVQFQFLPRENDHVQVMQFLHLAIEGEEAYWPAERLRLTGPEDVKNLQPHPNARGWLEHEDGAPYAQLAGPIPPGEVADLSIVYLLEHDGRVAIDWTPPFPLVGSSLVLPPELALQSPKLTAQRPPPGTEGHSDVQMFDLGQRPLGSSIEFVVADLPVRPRTIQWVAIGMAAAVLGGLALVIGIRPRRRLRERLANKRDDLLRLLDTTEEPEQRERIVAALDMLYRRLDGLDRAT